MHIHPAMLTLWIDKFGNDYNVLKFILTAKHEKQVWAVLNLNPPREGEEKEKYHPQQEWMKSGKDFDIYAKLIGDRPVPELKKYPPHIQQQYASHPCWISWAGIFDRKLTKDQRTILIHYRTAFLCLLVNGFNDYAEDVLRMAEMPQSSTLITNEFLYSPKVLQFILNLN